MAGLLGHIGSNVRDDVFNTVNNVMELIEDLGIEDLRAINEDVVRRIRMLRDVENLKSAFKFSVGETVSFMTKRKGQVVGKITKINRKTIGVKSGFVDWKVSPTLLRKGAPAHHLADR